jgi:hypothetical protein
MAVALKDTMISKLFDAKSVEFASPTSTTSSDTFTFTLNNSNDNILLVVDATQANPGSYTISFDKGFYPSAKAPAQISVYDGDLKAIAIESGMIEKKNSTASFTVISQSGAINATGIRFGIIKKRLVTNN